MNLTRKQARDISRFTNAVTVASAQAPNGLVFVSFVVEIEGVPYGGISELPLGMGLSQDVIAHGITEFYKSLMAEGKLV